MRSTLSLLFCFLIALASSHANAQEVRRPEVAGSFYPADPAALRDSIDRYLTATRASIKPLQSPVVAIIAPHAGYVFSGAVAACSYQELSKRNVRTVLLLGPSHFANYNGAALHHSAWWETPLGKLRVDTALECILLKNCNFLHVNDSAFTKEHSVEDQLPFIQRTLGDVQIVPIACGTMGPQELRILGELLAQIVTARKGQAVVVASSDMSHYKTASLTTHRDSIALNDVTTLDADKLITDISKGSAEFCGIGPVLATMYMSEQLGALPHFVAYTNSARATRDTNRVVGYGAFALYLPEASKPLSGSAKQELLSIAKQTVASYVKDKKVAPLSVKDSLLLQKQGAFVTLRRKGELRGCIGSILPLEPLAQVVTKMSQSACSKDPRFQPMTADELKDTKLEISVLGPLHRVRLLDQIKIGTHGLVIQKGDKMGVFLPQVAVENKWTRDQFLEQLALKAGLNKEDWKAGDTRIFAFTAEVFGE